MFAGLELAADGPVSGFGGSAAEAGTAGYGEWCFVAVGGVASGERDVPCVRTPRWKRLVAGHGLEPDSAAVRCLAVEPVGFGGSGAVGAFGVTCRASQHEFAPPEGIWRPKAPLRRKFRSGAWPFST